MHLFFIKDLKILKQEINNAPESIQQRFGNMSRKVNSANRLDIFNMYINST